MTTDTLLTGDLLASLEARTASTRDEELPVAYREVERLAQLQVEAAFAAA